MLPPNFLSPLHTFFSRLVIFHMFLQFFDESAFVLVMFNMFVGLWPTFLAPGRMYFRYPPKGVAGGRSLSMLLLFQCLDVVTCKALPLQSRFHRPFTPAALGEGTERHRVKLRNGVQEWVCRRVADEGWMHTCLVYTHTHKYI